VLRSLHNLLLSDGVAKSPGPTWHL
jgi:hypothetical protein